MNKTERYIVRDRETGTYIVDAATLNGAYAYLDQLERADRLNGVYEANFYEIYDSKDEEIISNF